MIKLNRREVLTGAMGMAATMGLSPALLKAAESPNDEMRLGLVTYLWGAKWDLDTCLKNCTASKVLGLELRTTHSHGVEPDISKQQRSEVKKKFDDSPVACVGPGSNECYDHTDPTKLQKAIETTKRFLQLSHDIGGSGVKVKPNNFQKSVPREKTIEQVGKALGELAVVADGLGQELRVEVHGTIGNDFDALKQIMEIADHRRAVMCWNCNEADLKGKGLQHNFNLISKHFGQTAHVRELNEGNYPYQQLINLLTKIKYHGWVLLECRNAIKEPVKAMTEQRTIFESMVAKAKKENT